MDLKWAVAEDWRVRLEVGWRGSGHPGLGEVWRLRGLKVEVQGEVIEMYQDLRLLEITWAVDGEWRVRGEEVTWPTHAFRRTLKSHYREG